MFGEISRGSHTGPFGRSRLQAGFAAEGLHGPVGVLVGVQWVSSALVLPGSSELLAVIGYLLFNVGKEPGRPSCTEKEADLLVG